LIAMPLIRFCRMFTLSLCCLAAASLGALETKSYWMGHQFITEGIVDPAPWYEDALSAIQDYDNYNNWALKGLDGKDPVSAGFWENFKSFVHDSPDTMVIKMTLRLPKPFGIATSDARFKIDTSRLDENALRFVLISQLIGVTKAVLVMFIDDSATAAKTKRLRFRIIFGFVPLIEGILRGKEFDDHMRLVTGILAGNLEAYCAARRVK
jgi:hypothetical protein